MSKRTLFKYSALAVSLFCLYPATVAANTSAESSPLLAEMRGSIESPRQFVLDQPGEPNMVEKQYRWHDQTPLQSTGFWVEKGETVKINVNHQGGSLTPALEFFVTTPDDRTTHYRHAFKKALKQGDNTFSSEKSGIIYIANYHAPITGDIKINILSGAKPFARFVLNQHSAQDYQQMLSQFKDIPYVELVSKRMMITLRGAKALKHIGSNGPEEMLKNWDKIVTLAENQYGLTEESTNSPHQRIRHRFHWLDGISLPGVTNNDNCGGYMNSSSWRMQACTEDAIADIVNNKLLTSDEGWGGWHELGHQFQMIPIDWGTSVGGGNMTEVVVNLTSLYVQREMGMASRLESGRSWDEDVFPYLNQSKRDYHNLDSLFTKVAMLWQLDLTFGSDFYARLGKVYREIPQKQQPANSDEKVQRFILETSRLSGYDLTPFFDKWGLPITQQTKKSLGTLDLKKLDVPIWDNRDSNIRYDLSQGIEKPLSAKLQNASAESGDLSHWRLDQGQFRVVKTQDGIKPALGSYFFTARLSDRAADYAHQDQMTQSISLDKATVSQGESTATLSFKSNSWGDGDFGTVSLIARDKQGDTLQTKAVDTQSIRNKWLDNHIVMALPADSATLAVQVQATKKSGEMSDVHFDDFVLKVEKAVVGEPDNLPPVAHASVNPTSLTGAGKITLSASGSYDPEGEKLIYRWKQVAGPTVSLGSPNKLQSTAQLSAVSQKTLYSFEVTVTDVKGAYATRAVSMTQQPEVTSTVPAWDRSKTYPKPCVKVSYQGKEWFNGWWTVGNIPGSDGTFGVWREMGAKDMHAACK